MAGCSTRSKIHNHIHVNNADGHAASVLPAGSPRSATVQKRAATAFILLLTAREVDNLYTPTQTPLPRPKGRRKTLHTPDTENDFGSRFCIQRQNVYAKNKATLLSQGTLPYTKNTDGATKVHSETSKSSSSHSGAAAARCCARGARLGCHLHFPHPLHCARCPLPARHWRDAAGRLPDG